MAQIDQILQWLKNEVNIWTAKGIITAAQKDKILGLYKISPGVPAGEPVPAPLPAPKHESRINIARVILVLGVICIAVGLVIFYASNWRKMPPGLKLAQVFILITACYGAAWYLFFVKKEIFAARLILMLAMVTFGIGIMLVAQIYHISSHPTNGVMVWAIGTLVMSMVMNEKWGYWMSLALFILWDYWEVTEYGSSAYPFIIPVLVLGFLFYRKKDVSGITLSVILTIIYWFQVNLMRIDGLTPDAWYAFLTTFYMLGISLMIAGRTAALNALFKPAGHIAAGSGWFLFIIPLLALSWPFKIPDTKHLLTVPEGTGILLAQLLVFTLLSCAGIFLLRKRGTNPSMYIPFLASAFILIIVPHYNTTARMISTHIIITLLMASSLAIAYTSQDGWRFERGMAFMIVIILFLAKWFGLTGSSYGYDGYNIAYLVGFIIFATVVFLVNRLVKHISTGSGYPSRILDILASVSIWITLYAASARIENQKSIFSADKVVIVMIFLFISMAVLLYMYLLSVLKDSRVIIYLSMVIFILSGITLFIAGEGVSWIVYSLVFNTLLITATGTAIYYSTVIQSRALLNTAICAFLLHIATRYFDLFWDMFSGSVLFITTGILAIAGGYLLEKKRRQIINSFESQEAGHE